MAKAPVEVTGEVHEGGAGADVFYDDAEGYYSNWYGYGGNDLFVAHVNDAQPIGGGSPWYQYTNDYFYGGAGTDTVSYNLSDEAVVANLTAGVAERFWNGQVQSRDYLSSIEGVLGSQFDDTIFGSATNNTLQGAGGHDLIYGLDGDDRLLGDSGNDTLSGGDGHDTLEGSTGNDSLAGGDGNDQLLGGDGEDTLNGGNDDDSLSGGEHGDSLLGAGGNDTLDGGAGNDTMAGGSGTDTVVYTGNGAVTVNLLWGIASGAQGNDQIAEVENVVTGGGADVVFGTDGANRVETGGGADVVYAFGGNDTVEAGGGNDTVYGYDGNDRIEGDSGADSLYGDGGNDTVLGESGNDKVSGGAGADSLHGGDGNDTIRGGEGADTTAGGFGNDVFRWERGDTGQDVVLDYNLAEDRLSFSADFFAVAPVGAVDLEDVLMVFDAGDHAVLAANTATDGWQTIATLRFVDAYAVGQMIEDESILAVSVGGLGGGALGGILG